MIARLLPICLGFICAVTAIEGVSTWEQILNRIHSEISDLTNPLDMLSSGEFVKARSHLNFSQAQTLTTIVAEGKLKPAESVIALHLVSTLPEATYWKVTDKLLTTNTPTFILETTLYQKFPFGPTYANSFTNAEIKNKLQQIKLSPSVTPSVKVIIDNILSGRLGEAYKKYKRYPKEMGY